MISPFGSERLVQFLTCGGWKPERLEPLPGPVDSGGDVPEREELRVARGERVLDQPPQRLEPRRPPGQERVTGEDVESAVAAVGVERARPEVEHLLRVLDRGAHVRAWQVRVLLPVVE